MLPTSPTRILRGHNGAVYDLAWSTENSAWYSAGGDGVVARWNEGQNDGIAVFQHSSPFYSVADWHGIVVGGNSTGELFFKWPDRSSVQHEHGAPIFSLTIDDQGALWSGDGEGLICRWDMVKGQPSLSLRFETSVGKIRHLTQHGENILAAGGEGFLLLVDPVSGQQSSVSAHDRSCYWAIPLVEKGVILSGGQDGQLKVHQASSEILSMDVHQSAIYRGMIWGDKLWTCGRDHEVKAWDLNTLNTLGKLPRPHTRSVNALAIGGLDGQHLATAGDDRSIKIWMASPNDRT